MNLKNINCRINTARNVQDAVIKLAQICVTKQACDELKFLIKHMHMVQVSSEKNAVIIRRKEELSPNVNNIQNLEVNQIVDPQVTLIYFISSFCSVKYLYDIRLIELQKILGKSVLQ